MYRLHISAGCGEACLGTSAKSIGPRSTTCDACCGHLDVTPRIQNLKTFSSPRGLHTVSLVKLLPNQCAAITIPLVHAEYHQNSSQFYCRSDSALSFVIQDSNAALWTYVASATFPLGSYCAYLTVKHLSIVPH